jgi:hypothetical protein
VPTNGLTNRGMVGARGLGAAHRQGGRDVAWDGATHEDPGNRHPSGWTQGKTSVPASGTSATAGVSAMASLRLPHHGNCDRDRGSSRAGQDRGEGPSATLGRPAHSHAARPPPWVTRQARSIEAFDDAWIVRDNALNQASESHPRRRPLGPRLAHGALVGVTPRLVVVAVSVHRLFERAGTHVKKPTSGRARSRQDQSRSSRISRSDPRGGLPGSKTE